MSTAVLAELLTTAQRYAPEYRGGLSTHLPMALGALQALGADDDRLRQAFDRFAAPLGLAPRTGQVVADWTDHRGRPGAYADLLETFRRQIDAEGAGTVLRRVLPLLMPGVGAAAFHGLIRSAYGVAAQHDGETAAGLAYWACRWLPLEAPSQGVETDPGAWVSAMADALAGTAFEGGLIFERMRAIGRTEAFARHAGRLIIDAGTLQALADLAAQRYAASRNFTVLHLVTSCHALRLLLPHVDDAEVAVRHYALAYAAGCVASGIDLKAPPLPTPGLTWAQVVQSAVASNDEHVIKLVHSCRDEAALYGDGARLHAAALVVGT